MSDSQGPVDFVIGLVNSILNLAYGLVKVLVKEFKLQKKCNPSCTSKTFWGLVEMTFGLVQASHSLPKWQAVSDSIQKSD